MGPAFNSIPQNLIDVYKIARLRSCMAMVGAVAVIYSRQEKSIQSEMNNEHIAV